MSKQGIEYSDESDNDGLAELRVAQPVPWALASVSNSSSLLLSFTGVSVTLDETAGLQNAALPGAPPAEDVNDNDIAAASLPAAFAARLDVLLGTGTAPAYWVAQMLRYRKSAWHALPII